MSEPVKLSRERWDSLRTAYPTAPHVKMITLLTPDEINGITFLPATYVPEISAGEQSAIRAHEYLYGPTRLLGSA